MFSKEMGRCVPRGVCPKGNKSRYPSLRSWVTRIFFCHPRDGIFAFAINCKDGRQLSVE